MVNPKPTTRKTVKQVDVEQDTAEAALLDLFRMVEFLNTNRNWSIQDYMADPAIGFTSTPLAKLIVKHGDSE